MLRVGKIGGCVMLLCLMYAGCALLHRCVWGGRGMCHSFSKLQAVEHSYAINKDLAGCRMVKPAVSSLSHLNAAIMSASLTPGPSHGTFTL